MANEITRRSFLQQAGVGAAVAALGAGGAEAASEKTPALKGPFGVCHVGMTPKQAEGFGTLVLNVNDRNYPGAGGKAELAKISKETVILADVNIGAVGPHDHKQPFFQKLLDSAAVKVKEKGKGLAIADLTNDRWKQYVRDQITAVTAKGATGIFLNTADAPLNQDGEPAEREKQTAALVDFLKTIRDGNKDLKIVINNPIRWKDGSEVESATIKALAPYVDGIAQTSYLAEAVINNKEYAKPTNAMTTLTSVQKTEGAKKHELALFSYDEVGKIKGEPAGIDVLKEVIMARKKQGFIAGITNKSTTLPAVLPPEVDFSSPSRNKS